MEAKGRSRYSNSPSNFVAMRGNETPINKEIPTSKRHSDYDFSLLRQSANQLLSPTSLTSPREIEKKHLQGRYSNQGLAITRPIADFAPGVKHIASLDYEPFSPKSVKQSFHFRNGSLPSPGVLPYLPKAESDKSVEFAFSRKPRPVEFLPYSLKDYNETRPNKYQTLGGIGPARVGTKVWEDQKLKQRKMRDYSERVAKEGSTRGNFA